MMLLVLNILIVVARLIMIVARKLLLIILLALKPKTPKFPKGPFLGPNPT